MELDVIIIGAGVLGVSAAYHLGRMGKHVLLLEKEAVPAAHASGKNAGMIRQLYQHPQLTEWTRRSIAFWPDDIRASCFQQTGSVVVGRELPGHHDELFEQLYLTTWSGGTQKQTPCVATRTDGLLDSGGYVLQLYQQLDRAKVTSRFRCEVTDVRKDGESWLVTTLDGERFEAPWIVNAGGAWINHYLKASPLMPVSAQPFARHLFLTTGWQDDLMPTQDCGFYWEEEAGWYMRLWEPQMRLVSVCERIPADPALFCPHPEISEEIALKLLGSLPDAAVSLGLSRSWHCFRTYTEDQLPIWGEDPHFSGLFWLGAFGGFGMSTSFAATYDAALAICGQSVEIPSTFSPQRVKSS